MKKTKIMMDAKLLHELKFEMDRIYIGGIRLAKNNQCIIKLLPSLEKHIDEDIAYGDLVSNLKKLIYPKPYDFIELLSNIHASLDYLLRLHGEVLVAGEERVEQVPVFNINDISTPQHSFLELKPLIDALNGIGKDRLNVILKAREQKLFDDFRTHSYLRRTLVDKEVEIVELIKSIIREDLKDKMI